MSRLIGEHRSLLSHNDNNDIALAALQKISAEVIQSYIKFLSTITKLKRKSLGLDKLSIMKRQTQLDVNLLCTIQ